MGDHVNESVLFIKVPEEHFQCCWWLYHLKQQCPDQAVWLAVSTQSEKFNGEVHGHPFCKEHAEGIHESFHTNPETQIFFYSTEKTDGL